MRLVTFSTGAETGIGISTDRGIIDLARSAPDLPRDMVAFLEAGDPAMAAARSAMDSTPHFALDEVKLKACLPRPPKILAIGLNYRAHAEESGMEIPKTPFVFTKQSTSANGPYDPIHWSEDSKMLDYEGELGVVIGKRARRVPQEKAADVIAGFCIVNDVSVRDWQLRGNPASFTMGKSWDTHCPMGPAIVTPDEVGDPHALQLKTHVNGELRQDTNTDDLIFNSFQLISFLSTAFTLEPGDLIPTGTPSGVGFAMQPRSTLVVGDIVRIEIDKLGHIENEVIEEPTSMRTF